LNSLSWGWADRCRSPFRIAPPGKYCRRQQAACPQTIGAFLAHGQVAVLDRAGQVGEMLAQQAGERQAAHPHGVDGQEQEPAVFIEQLAAIADQRREAFLEPPGFVLRTAPELGRIEDDPVVAAAAADLARGELGGIVDQPADRAAERRSGRRRGPSVRPGVTPAARRRRAASRPGRAPPPRPPPGERGRAPTPRPCARPRGARGPRSRWGYAGTRRAPRAWPGPRANLTHVAVPA